MSANPADGMSLEELRRHVREREHRLPDGRLLKSDESDLRWLHRFAHARGTVDHPLNYHVRRDATESAIADKAAVAVEALVYGLTEMSVDPHVPYSRAQQAHDLCTTLLQLLVSVGHDTVAPEPVVSRGTLSGVQRALDLLEGSPGLAGLELPAPLDGTAP